MTDSRKLEAYRRRLARISDGAHLTAECLGAVVTVYDVQQQFDQDNGWPEVQGGLVAYTTRFGVGLFGPKIATDVTLCAACAHQDGDGKCGPAFERTFKDALLVDVRRNGDGPSTRETALT